ncbi:hypothetical protein MTO96_039243, partial [Rhipicephalus appendiculatus]
MFSEDRFKIENTPCRHCVFLSKEHANLEYGTAVLSGNILSYYRFSVESRTWEKTGSTNCFVSPAAVLF